MMSAEKIDPVVDFLVEQFHGDVALEFAIGTARIALALAQRRRGHRGASRSWWPGELDLMAEMAG